MKFPNLLASRRGRLATFFFLYVTEGIPLGFTATAIATEMRRQGMGPAAIAAFIGSLYLPWTFKFLVGPFVDVFTVERFGRRRMWIILAQVAMVGSLLAASPVNFNTQIALFTALIFIHNLFGATQDVAIDALAVGTLREEERGLANGMMFAGAYLGQTIGGAGVLKLTGLGMPFKTTFFVVGAWILAVTLLVALPLREPRAERAAPAPGPRLGSALGEVRGFLRDSYLSFLGTRSAFVAVFFALLPPGSMALSGALASSLSVELGLSNDSIAALSFWGAVIAATGCVVGGLLSDRLGRRRMLAIYIALMGVPTLWFASQLQHHGWIMPITTNAPDRPVPAAALVTALWIASLVYSGINGLMYGTRTALFMDVTNPAVAATQFTAYMALLNVMIAYSMTWQGAAAEAIGYPKTMLIDVVFGLAGLALLPLMRKPASSAAGTGAAAAGAAGASPVASDGSPAAVALRAHGATIRARGFAAGLGLAVLLWIPYDLNPGAFSSLRAVFNLAFTLAFVISGLFLAGSVAIMASRALSRLALGSGALLIGMHAFRYYAAGLGTHLLRLDPVGSGMSRFLAFAEWYQVLVPLGGGLLLLALASGKGLSALKAFTPAAAEQSDAAAE
jgi:hypothetical protein